MYLFRLKYTYKQKKFIINIIFIIINLTLEMQQ